MVVIKKRNNIIPVDFEDFKLEFKANDASIKNLTKIEKQLEEHEKQLNEQEYSESFLDDLKDTVKGYWIDLFDEAAFEKVYDYSDGATLDTFLYLIATIRGILEEFEGLNNQDALSKYLDVKK